MVHASDLTPPPLLFPRPLASFEACSLEYANRLLVAWEHKDGPISRPCNTERCFVLLMGEEAVAVAIDSVLIRLNVSKRVDLNRSNTIELSRLCASSKVWNRVVLRVWREVAFPQLGFPFAISYQDLDRHTGNTYRFDGWECIGESHSGTDQRSGRPGKKKKIWLWGAL